MENLEWKPVFYNELETNIELTKNGYFRKVQKDWYGINKGYNKLNFVIKNYKEIKSYNNGYIRIVVKIQNIGFKNVYFHQLVAAAFLDYKFNGYENVVDHIDSNPLNNNLENLRVISQRENCSKEKTLKKGLPVGVSFNKERNNYSASIYIKPNKIKLGRFKTIDEASNAYQNALLNYKKYGI
ncbi:MAG: HNH endonuclease [Candidatus Nanopelagicaceae bacterium]